MTRYVNRLIITTLVTLVIYMVVLVGKPKAHLVRTPDHPKRNHLENRKSSQQENLAHARYVARHGKGRNARWHRHAMSWINKELQETIDLLHRKRELAMSPRTAIHWVFGRYGSQAVAVAYCETGGTFDLGASNGQYLGLFQMGSSERAKYGHSSTAIGQARSAYSYFADSGYDWSPWACKP